MTSLASFRRFDGARAFSRVMAWICSCLSVLVVAVVGLVVLISGATLTCSSATANANWSGKINFDCKKEPLTTTSTIQHLPDGRTVKHTTITNASLGLKGLAGLVVPLAPALMLGLAMWQAGRFFAQLSKGLAFHARTVARLRNFSILGVLLLGINPLTSVLNAPIEKALDIGVTTLNWNFDIQGWHPTLPELMNIVFAATLIAMVSVLARAATIAEDHAQIV